MLLIPLFTTNHIVKKKTKKIFLHRVFRDDEESIAKHDIKFTISSSTNLLLNRLTSYTKKKEEIVFD